MSSEQRALAYVVGAIRPDWDSHGITAAIVKATDAGYPFADVAHAAIDAARTASTKTPAGIGERLRGGWSSDAPYEKPTPTPPPVDELWRTLPPDRERVSGPTPEQREAIAKALRRRPDPPLFPDPRTTTDVPF